MSISLTKKLFVTWFTILILVSGWTIGPVLATWFPEHYFEWYPFIPVFFYIFGWFDISIFETCRRYAPQKIQLVYLGTKAIKMLFSLMVLLIYAVKGKCILMKRKFSMISLVTQVMRIVLIQH